MRITLISATLLTAACFLLAGGFGGGRRATAAGSAAAPTAPPQSGVTAPCPDGIEDIAHCTMPGGCGELGDALLNAAKNRTDIPSPAGVRRMTLDEIKALPQPARWDTGQSRTQATTAGEGRAVVVTGFLQVARHEGAESCNCGLTRRADTDVHLVLVSDLEEPEEDSVTVEITPRVREREGHLPNWLWRNVRDNLEGEFIRVTGRLMLDSKHIPQARLLPGERRNKGLTRATNWEVHPITRIEICRKSISTCNRGRGWEDYN